jgi:hypothetical protein
VVIRAPNQRRPRSLRHVSTPSKRVPLNGMRLTSLAHCSPRHLNSNKSSSLTRATRLAVLAGPASRPSIRRQTWAFRPKICPSFAWFPNRHKSIFRLPFYIHHSLPFLPLLFTTPSTIPHLLFSTTSLSIFVSSTYLSSFLYLLGLSTPSRAAGPGPLPRIPLLF